MKKRRKSSKNPRRKAGVRRNVRDKRGGKREPRGGPPASSTDPPKHHSKLPEHHPEPPAQPPEPSGHLADCQRRAAMVHELMARFPGENIEQLAARIGISPHTLSLSYKAATGNCLQDVIVENCLQYAARLLTTGTQEPAIKEIADLCGYTPPSSFNHAFKRRFGKSPREYRRSGME